MEEKVKNDESFWNGEGISKGTSKQRWIVNITLFKLTFNTLP